MPVVEDLDVAEQDGLRGRPGFVVLVVHMHGLEGVEEALHHRVVVAASR